jgi:hypothetical protein
MLITDREAPPDIPEANPLLDPQLDETPPAYLSFGQTPSAIDDPPEIGEKRTYTVRVECTGENESVRNDGEHRFGRKLNILWAVGEGQPKPPDPSDQQPGLFDDNDEDQEPDDEEDGND